jgi:hypothetical protein
MEEDQRASHLGPPAVGDEGLLYTAAGVSGYGITAFDPTNGRMVWGPVVPRGCSTFFGGSGVSIGTNGLVYAVGDWNYVEMGD